MRRLILLRHGEAERAAPTGSDFDRALTARGRADAQSAGAWLADRGVEVHLALVSPAVRAQETWEAASTNLPGARCETPDSFYDAHPAVMLAEAERAASDAVLIVAHNPGLHTLAARLAAGVGTPAELQAALRRGLPPAGVVVFRDEGGGWIGEAFHAPDPAT